jgi:hypothetical protein
MRYLIISILFWGCVPAIANNDSDKLQKENEFEALMSKVSETNKMSIEVQKAASKKETQLVTKAIQTIVALKEENKELKLQLNEIKSKLNSDAIDTNNKFNLLPISNN